MRGSTSSKAGAQPTCPTTINLGRQPAYFATSPAPCSLPLASPRARADTHDDTGWQVTVDQYFFDEVYYVVDTVVDQLLKDPNRHFIYVEIGFFARWWDDQPDERRNQTKALVANGQLEFINGGWCSERTLLPCYSLFPEELVAVGGCMRPLVCLELTARLARLPKVQIIKIIKMVNCDAHARAQTAIEARRRRCPPPFLSFPPSFSLQCTTRRPRSTPRW